MGACSSNGRVQHGSKGDMRRKGRSNERRDVLVLLLGAGSVGKTTLKKQLILIDGPGYTPEQRNSFIPIMQKNVINSMQVLCAQSEALGIPGCTVTDSNRLLRDKFLFMKESEERLSPELAHEIHTLWRDPGIQQTYTHRSVYKLSDGAGYFLEKVKNLCEPASVSDADILRCSARTTGIVETEISSHSHNTTNNSSNSSNGNNSSSTSSGNNTHNNNNSSTSFTLYDVGGQRHERRKWTHLIGKAKVIVFVVDTSGFDETIVEDPTTNRLTEELNLFEGVCSMCPSKPIILVLNKVDTLKEKLENTAVKPVHAFHPACPANAHGVEAILSWMTSEFLSKNTNKDNEITWVATNSVDTHSTKTVVNKVKAILDENFG